MAKRAKLIKFKVTGSGEFPFDMLRYDRCWPATEADSYRIRGAGGRDMRTVTLATIRNADRQPMFGRWKSFGWRAESGEAHEEN